MPENSAALCLTKMDSYASASAAINHRAGPRLAPRLKRLNGSAFGADPRQMSHLAALTPYKVPRTSAPARTKIGMRSNGAGSSRSAGPVTTRCRFQ